MRSLKCLLLAGVVGLLAAGCGSNSDSSSGTTSVTSTAGSTSDARLAELYGKSGYQAPPATAPKPSSGKKVALVSCGQSVGFCQLAIGGAQEAAKALGWSTLVIDSKGDPNAASQGIKQAIAAKVDGIFIEAIDCAYIKQALESANAAKVPVVGVEGF